MDSSSRRFVQKLLKDYKRGRIIVLTTHYLDEVEELGDRIAIMSEGRLITCGSGLFLKNNFGVGYNLTIVKENAEVSSTQIIEYIRNFVPNMNVVSNVSAEIGMQLPKEDKGKFKELFEGLDANKSRLRIENYGISNSTLEEVFLKVAERDDKLPDQSETECETEVEADDAFEPVDRITNPMKLFFIHFCSIFLKRIR